MEYDEVSLEGIDTATLGGNDTYWSAKYSPVRSCSPLQGKTFYWLGSSVTLGFASGNESMADYLAARNRCTSVKEAVSGTTLRSTSSTDNSYVSRLKNSKVFSSTTAIDGFILQLSTNDANNFTTALLGELTPKETKDPSSFNVKTTCGAIEFIISYVRSTWNCPIFIYSGAYYSSGNGANYAKLVALLPAISQKWGVGLIDLYSDKAFNALGAPHYSYFMSDPIHPRKAGYRAWWTPKFEEILDPIFL